ncbi:unnamed protein product [Rotaria socialis]|uniref:SCP domain-containing protein n=1 Tax=Rotaria socialis TaxID=392032 RepID=A0A820MNJ5_9BILA|nr:unnamed protein product [Rotaria socialis]CAF3536962.1 unnamed protein product [Rotaria socialis]CAF3638094.1 unnamed protein product [Rotaria socialis]CAF3729099.1 unnamed protein product [Rotaria socialis]CAF3736140.1 unnamed protein product [Rotaria socialis]
MSGSTNPFGSFTGVFSQLFSLDSPDKVGSFFQQYWYVWLILSIGVVVLIAVNVAICCYFRHHRKLNEIDPTTGEKRLYNKDWGIAKPKQTLFIPIERNLQDSSESPLMIDDYDDSKFAVEALMAHNSFRLQHGAVPLQQNEYLNKVATDWARELVKKNQLQHSPDPWRRYKGSVLGENLAFYIGPLLTGERLTKIWYREFDQHDFNVDLQENSLHFSQLVWKGTREVGFGRCRTPDKKQWYGVAVYFPPGNYPNQYMENVQPRSDLENQRFA